MRMGWLVGIIMGALGLALGRAARAASGGGMTKIQIDETDPEITQWHAYVLPAATAAGVPADFAMAYLAIESHGNPCAVGNKKARGTDGNPKEIGLTQLYNPDDFVALGVHANELRAYCVSVPAGVDDPQRLSRPMTEAEKLRHVAIDMQKIVRDRHVVDGYLTASGYAWRTDGPDYWCAVKLLHGLPVIVRPGFATVRAALGRAPTSWREFRATYEHLFPLAKFDPGKAARHESQSDEYRALENAEWTGSHVKGPAIA